MQVVISSGLVERIVALAVAEPESEVCGLLLGMQKRIDDILPARNLAADPARRFEVDPAVQFGAIRAARGGGPEVVGCYHSHPSGEAIPSATDAAMIGRVGEIWLICAGERVRAWTADTAHSFVEVDLAERCACAPS